VARARGVIYDPEGNHVFSHAWGLGITTNNQVEACTLIQVMSIAINLGDKGIDNHQRLDDYYQVSNIQGTPEGFPIGFKSR